MLSGDISKYKIHSLYTVPLICGQSQVSLTFSLGSYAYICLRKTIGIFTHMYGVKYNEFLAHITSNVEAGIWIENKGVMEGYFDGYFSL